MSKKEIVGISSLLVAVLTLLFGDNIYQQITGRSFYGSHDVPKDITVTATTPPLSNIVQATLLPSIPTGPKPTSIVDLWQFYVDDIKLTIPNAPVTVNTLKEIAHKIPASVPFLAEAEVGLVPYQHTWKILDREGPAFLNAPEGGYAYVTWGYGTITTDRFSISFPAEEDNDHLVLVIGNPDDGTFKDLNTPLRLTDYSPGFAGINFATPAKGQIYANRNVINKAWLAQQLWWASKHRSITVTIWDVSNGKRFIYDVNPSNFVWTKK